MKPRNFGRALGIGVRVAGQMAGQRLAGRPQSSASAHPVQPRTNGLAAGGNAVEERAAGRDVRQVAAQAGRGVGRGVAGFLGPFRRVGGIVWLEVTGTFFLLFAGVFILRLWQTWTRMGEMPRYMTIAAAAVFVYLGVTSFWRARRR